MRRASALATLALLAAGCAPSHTLPPATLPADLVAADRVVVAKDWWKGFEDPALDRLMEAAFRASPTLESAVARVDASRARLGASSSAQWPSLDAQATAARSQPSALTNPLVQGEITTYAAGLRAFWEVDLWGRIRNEVAASRSDLLGAEYGRDAVALALAAQVAQGYFQLRSLDEQLDVTRRTVTSREESYKLRDKRFARGLTSELDLRQAESELAATRAQVPDLLEAIARTEGSLAELTGLSPAELFGARIPRGRAIGALPVPPVPEGLPSDLLLRRPDIQEAEQALRATQARVASARAAWFPVIGLSGSYGGESLALGDLFKGPARTWAYAGTLALPLFNGGLTAAQVDLASASERAAAADYRAAVIRAFSEARTALVAHQQAAERSGAREQAVVALRRQARLATLRYDNGYSSYLEVLDAERALFSAELAWSEARRQRVAAVVDLYRALGGGWALPPPPP